jgi:hypothetical protein
MFMCTGCLKEEGHEIPTEHRLTRDELEAGYDEPFHCSRCKSQIR